MKFKDIFIGAFLAGLLIYAFCHRAGIVGNSPLVAEKTTSASTSELKPDTLMHDKWIFTAHPETGLNVSTLSGETVYRNPDFRSGLAGINMKPDTTGNSLGMVMVHSDCGLTSPCFRILPDGTLESVTI